MTARRFVPFTGRCKRSRGVCLLEALGRWTLADLLAKPQPSPALRDRVSCRMAVRVPESLSDAEAAQ